MTFLDFLYKVQFNLYTSNYPQSTCFWGGQLHNRMSFSRIFFHNIWLCSWSIGGRDNLYIASWLENRDKHYTYGWFVLEFKQIWID